MIVSSNPLKFPKDSDTSSIVFKDSNEILLSLDFGKVIESGEIFNRDDIDFYHILQITKISTKFRKFTLNSTECTQKQVTLEVEDKTRCCLIVEMSRQSNDVSKNLKSGSIVEIEMFQILKYSHENDDLQFSVV